jgi:hypothetical protein
MVKLSGWENMPRLAHIRWIGYGAAFSCASLFLTPTGSRTDFRNLPATLEIKIERNSPALSALEDVRLSFAEKANEDAKQELKKTVITLRAFDLNPTPRDVAKAYLEEHSEPETFAERAERLVSAELERRKKSRDPFIGKMIMVSSESKGVRVIRDTRPSKTNAAFAGGFAPQRGPGPAGRAKGQLLLAGGADIRPKDSVRIYNGYGDLAYGDGFFRPKDRSFEVPIEKSSGEVVAQVFNEDGVLTAEGFTVLGGTRSSNELKIEVRPAANKSEVTVVDGHSLGLNQRRIVAEADVRLPGFGRLKKNHTTGIYPIENLGRASTFLFGVGAENFWPTLKFAWAGQRQSVNLLPQKSVQTLAAVMDPRLTRKDIEASAIGWGRIIKDGKPLGHAVVDLAFRPEERVTYLSGPIPDMNAVMTDQGGRFAHLTKKPGLEFLRVQQIGEKIVPVLVAFQAGHVTDLDLEVERETSIELQVASLDGKRKLPAAFNFVGEDEIVASSSESPAMVQRRLIKGLSMVEADPGSAYHLVRSTVRHNQRLVDLAAISTAWSKKLVKTETNELVIGKVVGDNFEVSILDSEGQPNRADALYVNPDGSPRTEKFGTNGGGYVIRGLSPGLYTLLISPEKNGPETSHVVMVDDRAIHYQFTRLASPRTEPGEQL